MRQVLPEVGLYAWQMNEILRLLVPLIEAGENPEDLGGALRPENGIGPGEIRHVERGVVRQAQLRVETEQAELEVARYGHPRILEQGRDVIGGMAEHAVLEIDQPDPGDAFAVRQPDQVRRMVVAQGPGGWGSDDVGEEIAPEIAEVGADA